MLLRLFWEGFLLTLHVDEQNLRGRAKAKARASIFSKSFSAPLRHRGQPRRAVPHFWG